MARLLPLLVVTALACSSRDVIRPGEAGSTITEGAFDARLLYVDERALEPGDGSLQRPLKKLTDALARSDGDGKVTIEVASGVYEGPFRVTKNVVIRGRGGVVVLHGDGDVVVSATGGGLERVLVQGGKTGLRVEGAVRLSQVGFSGQRQVAIDVVAGSLSGEELALDASVSELVGLSLRDGAAAEVKASKWTGPYRRGVEQHGGRLSLRASRFEDSVIAVHIRRGQASLIDVHSRAGREAAFLVGEAELSLRSSSVSGHEYGLLAGQGSKLDVHDFSASGTERAAIALTGSSGTLDGLSLHEGGSYAAIQLVRSAVTVTGAKIVRATCAGILINGGEVVVRDSSIVGSRNADGSSGDGIAVRQGNVTLEKITVSGAEGAAIVSGNAAVVAVDLLSVDGAVHGALVADYLGRLSAKRVVVRNAGEAAFVAIEGGTLEVDGAIVERGRGALAWVECASGSTMKLSGVKSELKPQPSACLSFAP